MPISRPGAAADGRVGERPVPPRRREHPGDRAEPGRAGSRAAGSGRWRGRRGTAARRRGRTRLERARTARRRSARAGRSRRSRQRRRRTNASRLVDRDRDPEREPAPGQRDEEPVDPERRARDHDRRDQRCQAARAPPRAARACPGFAAGRARSPSRRSPATTCIIIAAPSDAVKSTFVFASVPIR